MSIHEWIPSMDAERFWKIVELSRRGFDPSRVDGNMARQLEELRRLLLALPRDEIVGFRDQLFKQMDAAFHWDLWGAAYLIGGGCSDDGFTDFRGWLISMGRNVFERALADAESLGDVASTPGVEDVFFEEFLYAPARAYEEATGHEIPEYTGPRQHSPAGEKWSEEGSDLQRRLPRLWEKYSSA
jgi:hypothetical protein